MSGHAVLAVNSAGADSAPDRPFLSSRLGIVVFGFAAAAAVAGEFAWVRWAWSLDFSLLLILLDVLTYAIYIVTGAIAWRRRPQNRVGPLLIASGLAAYASGLWAWDLAYLTPIGLIVKPLGSMILFHALLAFPSGRLRGWLDRSLVAANYVIGLGVAVIIALSPYGSVLYGCNPPCDAGPVIRWVDSIGARTLWNFRDATLLPFAIALVCILGVRWYRASVVSRRVSTPVLLATFAYVAIGTVALSDSPDIDFVTAETLWYVAQATIPVTMLVGILRLRLVRGGVGGLVLEMRAASKPAALEGALKRALRDPTLRLLTRDQRSGGYVDGAGQPTMLPASDSSTNVTVLERGDRVLGALLYDPGLLEEKELLQAASEAASLALENEWLQAELRRQLDSVRASRARIVAVADMERRKVERDLHDGAQQRLVDVALSLGEAQAQLKAGDNAATRRTLAGASEGVRSALAELRDLARGIHPQILTEEGLEAAVRALAARSRVPTEVSNDGVGRLAPTIEATAYFVVAEALANAAKHAQAGLVRIRLSRDDEFVEVDVADDGKGGADAAMGTGLVGLEDRVAALGGRLTVASDNHNGTRVVANIPCA